MQREVTDEQNPPEVPPCPRGDEAQKKLWTGLDVHNRAKVYRDRLRKFSKESFLLHLSFHAAWRDMVGDFILTEGIEELERQLKEWGGAARSNNRFKRANAILDSIENGTWRPSKKRKRKKRQRRK